MRYLQAHIININLCFVGGSNGPVHPQVAPIGGGRDGASLVEGFVVTGSASVLDPLLHIHCLSELFTRPAIHDGIQEALKWNENGLQGH